MANVCASRNRHAEARASHSQANFGPNARSAHPGKRLRRSNPTAPSTIRLIASDASHAELSRIIRCHCWIKNEFASHHGRLPVGGRRTGHARQLAPTSLQRMGIPQCPRIAAHREHRARRGAGAAVLCAALSRRRQLRQPARRDRRRRRGAARQPHRWHRRVASRTGRVRMVRPRPDARYPAPDLLRQQVGRRNARRHPRRSRQARPRRAGHALHPGDGGLGLWRQLYGAASARHERRHPLRRGLHGARRRCHELPALDRLGAARSGSSAEQSARLSAHAAAERRTAWRDLPLRLDQHRCARLGL
ncbi:hypothetical protein SAMN05216337_1003341 [Bradyrhizobium brasilense]|uniref:Uncharacterized protein n=1 Tax=Bradyrhizobium brasilense TaxID=1419277 RepID=A0A1G6MQH4_9BRAD|nr:hypothetical protein SAMN05216337_1003341 [Bradyrhizobium brasilense]